MELGINNSNYAIQNNNNNNNNNMKKNNSPNFKSLIITNSGKKSLTKMATSTKEKFANTLKLESELNSDCVIARPIKILARLKEIKPMVEKSEFYDLVFDGALRLGIKPRVEDSEIKIGLKEIMELVSEDTDKVIKKIESSKSPEYEKVIKIFQVLEERANAKFEEMKMLASYFLNDMK